MSESEMRISKNSDVRKSVGFLFYVLKKLKRPVVLIKAIGQATQVQEKIIEELKNDIKGYNITVEREFSSIFGLPFVTAIVRAEEIVDPSRAGQKFYGDEPHNEEEYQKKKKERRDREGGDGGFDKGGHRKDKHGDDRPRKDKDGRGGHGKRKYNDNNGAEEEKSSQGS